MAKQKYNFNGTLLNLLLLGGAAVILKNRTGSLRGVGSTKRDLIEYLNERLNVLKNELTLHYKKYQYPNLPKTIEEREEEKYKSGLIGGKIVEVIDILNMLRKGAGVGAIHSREWIINYINHRLDVYDRQLPKLIDKNAIETNIAVQEELHSILKQIHY